MATLNFIKGTIRGKIGEFVGSSWRGKSYIKTFTKPGNPRTAGQVAVRTVFQNVSQFAKSIYEKILKPYTFPKPRKMTAYNRMIQINQAMFNNKEWDPAGLKIFEGPLENPGITTAALTGETVKVSFSATPGHEQDRAIALIYNSETGDVIHKSGPRAFGFIDVSVGSDITVENLHAYLVFVFEPLPGTSEQGVVSSTSYKKVA
ncbi:MAG: DUF6266 family protein [Treponema sp.]|jgi:hypothetical protein|nr:DUF6266 family protein [Treponema sp.]